MKKPSKGIWANSVPSKNPKKYSKKQTKIKANKIALDRPPELRDRTPSLNPITKARAQRNHKLNNSLKDAVGELEIKKA